MTRDLVDRLAALLQSGDLANAADSGRAEDDRLRLELELWTASALVQRGALDQAIGLLASAAGRAANAGDEASRQVASGLLALAEARAERDSSPEAATGIEGTLELAAALDPIGALPALAQHVEADGRPEEAIDHWRTLLQLRPGADATTYLHLARLYEQVGQPEEALSVYLRLLDEMPGSKHILLVGQKLDALSEALPEAPASQRIKIALLGNASMEQLQPHLSVECYKNGLRPQFYEAGFDQYTRVMLDPSSGLYAFEPDVTVCAIHASRLFPGLHRDPIAMSAAERRLEMERGLHTVQGLLDAASEHGTGMVLLHTMVAPQYPALGILDSRDKLGQGAAFAEINLRLAELVRNRYANVYLVDEDRVQAHYGKAHATDARLWLAARMPWSEDVLSGLAREYLRFIRPLKGLSRKVIVLDLDNTLWGGIIGEDGLSGIQLASDAPGNAYVAFQRELEKLWRRGVLLAICSKNNESEALAVFERHPDMILKLSHFAATRINWSPKSENIKSLAEELSLGLSSFVFLDDNPRECEEVRAALPQVLTVALPSDPALYRETLLQLTVFDTLSLTQEDLDRNRQYAERRARQEFERSLPGDGQIDGYLAGLDVVVEIAPADALSIPRIAQLTNKTNQFNLTTRRYSESQIASMLDDGYQVSALRVRDRFGDEGLVGVAILTPASDGRPREIDTLLMSCRVIGRGIETALLAFLAEQARAGGASLLRGWFIPTGKNELVRDLFERHGFGLLDARTDGGEQWELDLAGQTIVTPDWLTVHIREPHAAPIG